MKISINQQSLVVELFYLSYLEAKTMDFPKCFCNKRLLAYIFIMLKLFIEPSLNQETETITIDIAVLKSLCCIECGKSKITPSADLCTAVAAFSNNTYNTKDDMAKLRCDLPFVYIIDEYSYEAIRPRIKLDKVDGFVTELCTIIDDHKIDAVAFDNLYPNVDTPKDEDWEKDVSEFFSKLGEKNPNILYGLVLPKNEKSLCINVVNVDNLSSYVNFFIATTFISIDETNLPSTSSIDKMEYTFTTLESFKFDLGNVIMSIKILEPQCADSAAVSGQTCSFTEADKTSIISADSLDNLFLQASLAYNYSTCGVLIQSIDQDFAESGCKPFPITYVINEGANGLQAPCDVISCILECHGSGSPTTSTLPVSPTNPTVSPGAMNASLEPTAPFTTSTPPSEFGGSGVSAVSPPSDGSPSPTQKDLSLVQRICGIGKSSSVITELPSKDLCTAFVTYSTNPGTKGQKLPLPSGNHSIVLIINDYSYYELREKIKLENSRAFKDEILAKIDDAGLSAVIFDNLYPCPDKDETYQKDLFLFFETLASGTPDKLFGLAIAVDGSVMNTGDFDVNSMNKVVDFYLTKTYYYAACEKEAEQNLMAITSPLDDITKSFVDLATAGYDLCRSVTLIHNTVNIVKEGSDASKPEDDISLSEFCTNLPLNEMYCRDSLTNFYKKGSAIREYNVYGYCFMYMDRDDFTGSCECDALYPVLTALGAGASGCPEPESTTSCAKLATPPPP